MLAVKTEFGDTERSSPGRSYTQAKLKLHCAHLAQQYITVNLCSGIRPCSQALHSCVLSRNVITRHWNSLISNWQHPHFLLTTDRPFVYFILIITNLSDAAEVYATMCALTNAPVSTNDDKLYSIALHAFKGVHRHRLRDVYSECAPNLYPLARLSKRRGYGSVRHCCLEHKEAKTSESRHEQLIFHLSVQRLGLCVAPPL